MHEWTWHVLVILVAALTGALGFIYGRLSGEIRHLRNVVQRQEPAPVRPEPDEPDRIEHVRRSRSPVWQVEQPEPSRERDTFERAPEPDQSIIPREKGPADFSEDEIKAGIEQLQEMYQHGELAPPEPAVLRRHAIQLLAGEPVEGNY